MPLSIRPLSVWTFSILNVLALAAPDAMGAACCGSSVAVPAIITGDDRAQVSASFSHMEIFTDVGSDSIWRRRARSETKETLKLEAAHIFKDRWQAGATVPLVDGEQGDLSLNVAYEFLTNWDYHPWRPKGFVYFQMTAPTGISPYDGKPPGDVTGKGFYTPSIGAFLLKDVGRWDFYSGLLLRQPLARDFETADSSGRLHPGLGGQLSLGAGRRLSRELRLGALLVWEYDDPIKVTGPTPSSGAVERGCSAVASASYDLNGEKTVSFAYTDQSLFGSPTNTSLGRTVSVFFQKRWLR
jgi:hypothetical protein